MELKSYLNRELKQERQRARATGGRVGDERVGGGKSSKEEWGRRKGRGQGRMVVGVKRDGGTRKLEALRTVETGSVFPDPDDLTS